VEKNISVDDDFEGWQIGFDFWQRVQHELQGQENVTIELVRDQLPTQLSNIGTGSQDILKRIFGN